VTGKRSWVESANRAKCQFPLENLPYGVFVNRFEPDDLARCGAAIGDYVLDLAMLERAGLIDAGTGRALFNNASINQFMAAGSECWATVRQTLQSLLAQRGESAEQVEMALQRRDDVRMLLPFEVAEYTDFYAGRHHAQNIGTILRGADNALPPNWLHIPIGYNGRASTVVVSGTEIRRPKGQLKLPDRPQPVLEPTRRLDIELEMGAVVGTGSSMGRSISVAEADKMIFGYVLLNDWSARDIQAWEYQPLGPFQAKAFATSISPWVVTKAALEPFRCESADRQGELLSYLQEPGPMLYDIRLQIDFQSATMSEAVTLATTNYREMYYSSAQQLCHHAIGGCKMNTGDLLGSGTISGPDAASRGSLMELSWGGQEPVDVVDGVQRNFLEDGDRVVLSGYAQGEGYRIGFGECSGVILPATA